MIQRINQVPVRPYSRNAVYDVIDGERDYQDAGEGNAAPHRSYPGGPRQTTALSLGEAIACMEEILAQSRSAWYRPDGQDAALPFIRKIAGVAVQVLENYGPVPREWHVPESANITGELHARDLGDKLAPAAF